MANSSSSRHFPDLGFFLKLIDKNGILQHSKFSYPQQVTGYSLDDNARGLVLAGQLLALTGENQFRKLIYKLLRFIRDQEASTGEFHNYLFISFNQRFLTLEMAEDSFGEVIWALGLLLSLNLQDDKIIKKEALSLFGNCLEKTESISGLRTAAYSLIGLTDFLSVEKNEKAKSAVSLLTSKLREAYFAHADDDWLWFENAMTYGNAVLPWALFKSAKFTKDEEILKVAERTLGFLIKKTTQGDLPVPVGQRGWYPRNGEKALFDQQPIEAGYMVLACMAALEVTGKDWYYKEAKRWFGWFHGQNLSHLSLIDKKNGGCYDGLEPWKVNLNKGAESTICYLLAHLALFSYARKQP